MERSGHVYSRISNPTNAVLEERVAALEGGVGAIATASGQAALHLAIATLMGAGSHIVASSALYGGSHNLLHYTLRALRHRDDLRQAAATSTPGAPRSGRTRSCCSARRSATRASTCSTSRRSRRSRTSTSVPLLVDSTFTTPYLLQPFEHGADLVYHSATKFLGGHGTVDRRRAGRRRHVRLRPPSGRFPEFTEPYDGFHGMVFSEESTRRRRSCCARAARACATSARA